MLLEWVVDHHPLVLSVVGYPQRCVVQSFVQLVLFPACGKCAADWGTVESPVV